MEGRNKRILGILQTSQPGVHGRGKAMRDAVSEKVRNKAYHIKVSSDSHMCLGM